MFEIVLVCLLLGVLAGLVAGLLGVGGGIVIVPTLAILFQAQGFNESNIMHLALGTSLATIAVTSISSVVAHHRLGSFNWPLVWWLTPGLMLGAALGALLADQVASITLQRLFGIFAMLVAGYMFWGAKVVSAKARVIATPELMAIGTLIGGVSAILGIGGGTMTVPYLTWRGRAMREAVAVSSACGFPIAVAGSAGYLLAGLGASSLPPLATGYLYWPAFLAICGTSLFMAPVGARLAHKLPVKQLKWIFALTLLVIGAVMVVKS